DHLGVFAYSDEDDTPAHTMPGHLSEELMTERKTELMELQRGISLKKNKALVGKKIKVLFEGTSSESELLYQGRHAGQTPEIDGVVLINSGTAKVGTFCTVKVTEAHEYDLVGKVV
ncbi:MAG TPA: TRAM domain-containing protein, partial [bacterium]|nr:TRAM domain-containing protein [bacterium]